MRIHYSRVRLGIWYDGKIQTFGLTCWKRTTLSEDNSSTR